MAQPQLGLREAGLTPAPRIAFRRVPELSTRSQQFALTPALRPASIRTLGEPRWLGACWGPNVMGGAAILTSASELAKQPSRAKGLAQSPGTRHLLELEVSLCCGAHRQLDLPERLVDFPGFPKMMKQNRQLSGDCCHGAFLSATAATSGKLKAPSPQVRVWT